MLPVFLQILTSLLQLLNILLKCFLIISLLSELLLELLFDISDLIFILFRNLFDVHLIICSTAVLQQD
jgi:hypothetical protein